MFISKAVHVENHWELQNCHPQRGQMVQPRGRARRRLHQGLLCTSSRAKVDLMKWKDPKDPILGLEVLLSRIKVPYHERLLS